MSTLRIEAITVCSQGPRLRVWNKTCVPRPKFLVLCVFAGLMSTVSACSSDVRNFTTTEVVVTPPNRPSKSQTMSLLNPPGWAMQCQALSTH